MYMELNGKVVEGSEVKIDAKAGRWVGVKNGVFCVHKDGESAAPECGSATVDYIRYGV